MYVYMKMNYETTINKILDYKKLADILGILLIMTLLCSLARQNTLYYQTMNALPREQRQFGDIQEESDWATKINMGDGLHQKAVSENKQIFLYPELPLMNLPLIGFEQEQNISRRPLTIMEIPAFNAEPAMESPSPTDITENPAIISPELPIVAIEPVITSPNPAISAETSATNFPKPIIDSTKPEINSSEQKIIADDPTNLPPNPPVPRIDTVIITPNSPAIADDSTIDSQKPPTITDDSMIKSPKLPAITDDSAIDPANPPTTTDDSAINPPNPPAITDDSVINPPNPPTTTDDSVINPPNPPAITDEPATDSPIPPTVTKDSDNNSDISDIDDEISPKEDIDNTTSLCNGFLCNSSGVIIGCQGIVVIDGVISFPSSGICTGIAANALTSLGAQVYEIYIPANITAIEEGAFNGLTELFYIEVHPDNPVYASNEGRLYEK